MVHIHSFDVCIIPYKNIERIKTVDMPLKLLDFLASGRPVIAKNINYISENKHLYKICNDLNEFNNALISSLEENDYFREQRIDFAKKNSWQEKSNMLGDWIINL